MNEKSLFMVSSAVERRESVKGRISKCVNGVVFSVDTLQKTASEPSVFMRNHCGMKHVYVFIRLLGPPFSEQTPFASSMPHQFGRVFL